MGMISHPYMQLSTIKINNPSIIQANVYSSQWKFSDLQLYSNWLCRPAHWHFCCSFIRHCPFSISSNWSWTRLWFPIQLRQPWSRLKLHFSSSYILTSFAVFVGRKSVFFLFRAIRILGPRSGRNPWSSRMLNNLFEENYTSDLHWLHWIITNCTQIDNIHRIIGSDGCTRDWNALNTTLFRHILINYERSIFHIIVVPSKKHWV